MEDLGDFAMEDCRGNSTLDETITITTNIIAIILVIGIGCISIRKLATDDKYEMHLVLEILYFTAIITACVILVGSIVSIIICKSYSQHVQICVILAVIGGGYIVICSALLASLIIRLYYTFRDSRWCISRTKLTLSLLLLLFADMSLLGAGAAWYLDWIPLQGVYLAQLIGLIIYVADSLWAVRNFSANLLSLAKMRAAAKLVLQEQPQLSDRPQRMINLSSKYVSLFILATSTTVMSFVVSGIFLFKLGIQNGSLWSIDCVVNTVCLYLYHNFAAHHYDRYCARE